MRDVRDDMGEGHALPFGGTSRFQELEFLGRGGMGVVYAAWDRERKMRVALKTLRNISPEALLRFKNEFRALQDLQHPNLVSLGELILEAGQWFFTMELVLGKNFLEHLRAGLPQRVPSRWADTETGPSSLESAGGGATGRGDSEPPSCDEARLRDTLTQLSRGLVALHGAGRLHRDIKPSNILVSHEGRVVVIDFGLVADVQSGLAVPDAKAIGTTAYMAPEQAAALPLSSAADWYSVGVVLYEAITGRLPFDGTSMDIVWKKTHGEPPPPRTYCKSVPADLDALCVSLLRRDPLARPLGPEVLGRLNAGARAGGGSLSVAISLGTSLPFVGREPELDLLRDAFRESRRKESAVTVLVHGESGIGKSALARHFATGLEAESSATVVLVGRCYERESVPYKAVDGVVDSLSRYLKGLPKIDCARTLPRRIGLLSQAFPALRHAEAIADFPAPTAPLDPQEHRARLFSALRELLAGVGAMHPLVVVIDDLQWADADSLALLREVLRPPDAPPLLLLATVRDQAQATGSPYDPGWGELRHIHLRPLPSGEAQALATLWMRLAPGEGAASASLIASEAGGHPLFIAELVRHTHLMTHLGVPGSLRLDDALGARIAQLDPPSRRLLELVCVAGGPVPQEVALQALGSDAGDVGRCLPVLRVGHLVRSSGARPRDAVEPYHDRVREAVVASLAPEARRARHACLAVALEADRVVEPETLAIQFRGAGDDARAARYAALAADEASGVLAFDRAARLFGMALELGGDPTSLVLRVKLGDALANAGRGAEAAAAYCLAAESASRDEALDLRRRAAEQFLTSGHVEEGIALLSVVLGAFGLRLASSPRAALFSILRSRVLLGLRGLRYRRKDKSQIPSHELARAETCWAVAHGFAWVDYLLSMDFQLRFARLALAGGEPSQVARAIAVEATVFARHGTRSRAHTAELTTRARALAEEAGDPVSLGLVAYTTALVDMSVGKWKSCYQHATLADAILRERCASVRGLVSINRALFTMSRVYLGELKELCRVVPLFLAEAEERGDLLGMTVDRTGDAIVVWLVNDDPEGAYRDIARAAGLWSHRGTLVHAYMQLLAQTMVDLYVDARSEMAWERLKEHWPAMQRTFLLRHQVARIVMLCLRARAKLAAAECSSGSPRTRFLIAAFSDARRIEKEAAPWSRGLARLLASACLLAKGDSGLARAELELAIFDFEHADMALHAAVARRRLGGLMGGAGGKALTDRADAWFAGQTVKKPERMVAMLAPGFPA